MSDDPERADPVHGRVAVAELLGEGGVDEVGVRVPGQPEEHGLMEGAK